MTPAEVERFWSKVDTSGGPDACWEWQGGTRKRNVRARRRVAA